MRDENENTFRFIYKDYTVNSIETHQTNVINAYNV